MISFKTVEATSTSINPISSPRISFSTDSLDDDDFISVHPNSVVVKEKEKRKEKTRNVEFEFLSSDNQTMLSADELFFDGKLLPFWQTQQSEKIKKMSLKAEHKSEEAAKVEDINQVESKISWFLDDDPSPRPPKCNVLWKELLRLRKQRSSTLSPSSSSSSSSSISSLKSLDLPPIWEAKEGSGNKDKHAKRMKKGLERTRSASIRIRPVVSLPVCTQRRRSAVPPLFSFRKGKLEK
ncbi:mental retardation GTPase activating protein-like [Heracleum sosnowskyi]|uniref:Mental retardation GTPase activating protein-like n=1 Tax=Heracleum sosnowskyi TaxID=360622 RepID=A0AAD8LV62_9APIA|nr:mental retardation GTPase activating protein-like [Heracleum sosnowskyi]